MKFWKIEATRRKYGNNSALEGKLRTRWIAFEQGNVIEVRDAPMEKTTDPITAVLEIHHSGSRGRDSSDDTGIFEFPNRKASDIVKELEALYPEPSAAPAKPEAASAMLGRLPVGMMG